MYQCLVNLITEDREHQSWMERETPLDLNTGSEGAVS